MQNLTARYNSIYNSKAMLDVYQIEAAENYIDDYEQILPVYLGPAPIFQSSNQDVDVQSMNEIIRKAQLIILEKRFSNYIDDAYILVGKANFFKGNYFDAVEYFDYTIKTYKQNTPIYIEALDWKARSLLQLKKVSDASLVIDTLDSILTKVKPKKQLANSLATIAQMHIYLKNNAEAISYLKRALKTGGKTYSRNRWSYILAQLYEKQSNYKDATANYRKVQLSNAPFSTYFNAILNQIKLDTLYTGNKVDKQYQLLKLLKEDKNFDYQDQIYYHIAESYAASQRFQEAEKYYLLSVQKANGNQNQKGLSFLKIADLNFRFSKDYLTAKSYYDSTITTLNKNYPGYDLILKKSKNLKYLTDRYETISLQDSLQAIAILPTELRETRIKTLANPVLVKEIENTVSANNVNPNRRESKTLSQNTFYFGNQVAIAMGLSEFKRKWGNRGLDNNWRQSTKTNILETNRSIDTSGTSMSLSSQNSSQKTNETLIAEYTAALPLTQDLLSKSNQQIIDAYYEIGSFYLYELNDVVEAENIYKTLLARFPSNNFLASIYYSLYLINKDKEPAEASRYRDLILKDFSNSIYGKTIIDPSFSIRQSVAETAANDNYNNLFAKYLNKDFNYVIKQTDEILSSGGSNYLHPQLAYLKAISIGRTNNVDSLILALNSIKDNFPNDQLITPLVKQHLAYLVGHMPYFRNRQIALIDFDPSETPFDVPQEQALVVGPKITPEQPLVERSQIVQTIPSEVAVKASDVKTPQNDKASPKVVIDGTFSNAVSSNYYFVIRVSDASLTLSSSRFGVGQFNRGNYSGSNLKHQLKEFDNDQLIYVGNFSNFADVKSYATGITPQLKQIMKVPVSIYSNFIISKENFDKLTSRELLDRYLEFYQKNIKNE